MVYLAVAAILIALSCLLDRPVHDLVFAYRTHWMITAAHWWTRYGEWGYLMLACLPFLLAAFYYHNDNWKRLLVTIMIVGSISGLAADVIRATTGRARPNAHQEVAPGWYGVRDGSRWLIADSRYNSFPSGHTAVAVGLIAPFFLLRRRVGWLLVPMAVLIALSRLILNAHHFSDVVAGALLAFGVAAWWLRYGSLYVPAALRPPVQDFSHKSERRRE